MQRHCDVGKRKQRIVGSGGSLCIYIQTGAGDPTAMQRASYRSASFDN